MVLETAIGLALGYIVKAIKSTKGAQTATDEMSTAVWDWVRPIFLVEDKETKTIQDLKALPDDKLNQQAAEMEIRKYLRDHPEKESDLVDLVQKLQAKGEQPAGTYIQQIHHGSGDNVGRDKIVGK